MLLLEIALIGLALWGSTALWLKIFDAVHARAWSSRPAKLANPFILACLALVPLGLAAWYFDGQTRLVDLLATRQLSLPLLYVVCCWCVAIWTAPELLRPHRPDAAVVLISNHTTHADLHKTLGDACLGSSFWRFANRIPGNQLMHLSVHHERIKIPRLPPGLEAMSIAHLSDLHFTGKIQRPFFDEVIRETNALKADVIAITGDIVDQDQCLDWLPLTLGQLQAAHGVYFVLGNHDRRHHADEIRRRLAECGLIDLGGHWLPLEMNGSQIILAGNELPWFSPPADLRDCPARTAAGPLRILLSHSPDQLRWAQRHDIDLMLAGHTHGGQVHLPWTGPLVSASKMGTDYAAGLIYEPPTVMHVSRGLSQTIPVRFGCPPELARLELHAGSPEA